MPTPEVPQTSKTLEKTGTKETITYKDGLLNTLDATNLTFDDKIEALQRYLEDKLSNLKNRKKHDIYVVFNDWKGLRFINRANNYIKSYLDKDGLNDTQKRNLIYLVSICSCYRDLVVKTLTELTEIELDKKRPYKIGELEINSDEECKTIKEELLRIESKKEFKGPYKIGKLEINSFEQLNSIKEELLKRESKKEFKGPYKIGKLIITSFEELNSERKALEEILEDYKHVKISSFSRAIGYAVEISYTNPKTPDEQSETFLFLGKGQLEPEDDKPQEKK